MTSTEEKERKESVELTKIFSDLDGRRPRLFMADIEGEELQNKEFRKEAASTFADAGWDVDVGSAQTPEETAQNAADNDVHFIFYTSDTKDRAKNAIAISRALAMIGRDDILIAVHQVPEEEKEALFRYGIICAFPKEYDPEKASLTMLRILIAREKEEDEPEEKY